jgi:hypothetical protein
MTNDAGEDTLELDETIEDWTHELKIQRNDKNEDLIEFLETSENPNELLCGLVNIGRIVQLAATFSTSEDILRGLFTRVDDRMDSLSQTIEEFQGKTQNASILGSMAEDIVSNQFVSRFGPTGDNFEVISNENNATDIKGTMVLIPEHGKPFEEVVRIEVKQYTKNVPEKEVKKFWRDLEAKKTRYGIFVSMKTKIAKHEDYIQVIKKGSRIGIIVSNETHEDRRHLVAWELLRLIVAADAISGYVGSGVSSNFMQMVRELENETEKLGEAYSELSELNTIGTNILSNASESAANIFKVQANVSTAVRNIQTRMSAIFSNAGPEYVKETRRFLDWKTNGFTDYLVNFDEKNHLPLMRIFTHLFDLTKTCSFTKTEKGFNLAFNDDNKREIKFTGTGKHVTIAFSYEPPTKTTRMEDMGFNKNKFNLVNAIKSQAIIPDQELIEAIRSIDPNYIKGVAEKTESETTSESQEVEDASEKKDKIPPEDDLKSMTKAELVELCGEKGLPISGTKADLIARILE